MWMLAFWWEACFPWETRGIGWDIFILALFLITLSAMVDAVSAKKQILDALNNVNAEDRINFLVNKLVNIDIETSKAKGLRDQANQVSTVSRSLIQLELF